MKFPIPMSSAKERAEFIKTTKSSWYTGTNVNGEEVHVFMQQGEGMTVKTVRHSKPRWFECVDYDKNGNQECTYYEALEQPSCDYALVEQRVRKQRATLSK